jgi:RNA polymerase sigma factor (sigma-70 family)
VYVIDDELTVRTALSRLISAAGHTVETFASPYEFMQQGCHLGAGCLVLDVRIPEIGGLEFQQTLRQTGSILPIIFLTGYGDVPSSVQAMKAGALDFLPKPVSEDALLRAIDSALQSDARTRAERIVADEIHRNYATLTPRERQVFHLMVAGRLNKQIARELGVSEKTVKVHRARVMMKMRVRRIAQLAQLALMIKTPAQSSEAVTAILQPPALSA